MRTALLTTAFFTSFFVTAQDTTQVDVNNTKINELNERLNNLLGTSDADKLDATSLKLDIIMNDIKEIKEELNKVKTSLAEIKTKENTMAVKEELTVSNSNVIAESKYYLVLASDRTLEGAKRKMKLMAGQERMVLVQNGRKSWYHLVLKEPITLTQAGQLTRQYRLKGHSDAWWTTGRKLVL